MNDIKVPPFTEGQQELIKMTEKLASSRNICDVDDIDDDIKDIKEIILETIAKIETQKQTNFQRITASPKALAEFVHEAENMCESCVIGDLSCNDCECQWCGCGGRKDLIDWLNEESQE